MSKPTITVCDRCLTASCWHGRFMCCDADYAGTAEKTLDELRALGLEHPDNWDIDPETGVARRNYGQVY